MKIVATRLAYDADLAGGASAVFGRIVARLDAKLSDSLKTGLKPESSGRFAIQVPRRSVDDGAVFNTIEANRILLVGASAEPYIVEASAARGLRARGKQIELRQLASVKRQGRYLARIYVGADRG